MNWWVVAGQTLAAVLGGAGIVALINALAGRRRVKVDAADRLNDSTLEWAERLKADAADARREAAEARREAHDARTEATEARREMAKVKVEAEALVAYLHRIVNAIHDPHITVERLRAMVGEPGANGVAGIRAS